MSKTPHEVPTSYLTDDDLLDTLPSSTGPARSTSSFTLCGSAETTAGTASRTQQHRVQFCPLALLYTCAADGKKDEVLCQASKERGSRRLAVRTYSLDASNLQTSSKKAWGKVVSSFAASLQPIISPNAAQGHGVASFSRSLPEDDYFPTTTNSPGSYCKEDDDSYFPSHNRVSIRLPSLSRKLSSSQRASSLDTPRRGILKSPQQSPRAIVSPVPLTESPTNSSSTSSPSQITLPLVASPSDLTLLTFAVGSPLATALPPPLSSRLKDENHLSHILTVPVTQCCPRCYPGSDYGVCDDWREHFSKSARRKRREDASLAEKAPQSISEDAEVQGNIPGQVEATEPERVVADDEEDVPLRIGTSRMSLANVDELGCTSVRRLAVEKEGSSNVPDAEENVHDEEATINVATCTGSNAVSCTSESLLYITNLTPKTQGEELIASNTQPISDSLVPTLVTKAVASEPVREVYVPPPTSPFNSNTQAPKRRFSFLANLSPTFASNLPLMG
ncbi:hypothetical protein P7C70_g248, partial [Phenoliferia sp. Uapishka_3]